MQTNKTANIERVRDLFPAAVGALDFEVAHFEIDLASPDVQLQAVSIEGDVANWCGGEWDFM